MQKNNFGFSNLAIIITAVVALGGGGFAYQQYTSRHHYGTLLNSHELKAYHQAKNDLAPLSATVMAINTNNLDALIQPQDDITDTQQAIEAIKQEIETLLSKDPCVATQQDLEKAIELARQARIFDITDYYIEGGDHDPILDWARDVAMSITSHAARTWEADIIPSFYEKTKGLDLDNSTEDVRTFMRMYRQHQQSFRERMYLAEQLTVLGAKIDIVEDFIEGDLRKMKQWAKDNCKAGYSVELTLKDSKEFAGEVTGSWDMAMKLTTCDQDTANAKWDGAWEWTWVATKSEGAIGKNPSSGSISFTTSNNQASTSFLGTPANVLINKDTMTLSYRHASLGMMNLSGAIMPDYISCSPKP